jgi:hypothetical protein
VAHSTNAAETGQRKDVATILAPSDGCMTLGDVFNDADALSAKPSHEITDLEVSDELRELFAGVAHHDAP